MAAGDIRLIASSNIDDECYFTDFIHISGDTYASCYSGVDVDGWLKTFTIDAAGVISLVIDDFEWDIDRGGTPSIVHVSGEVYAIAYFGPDNDGFLITLTIQPDGTIGAIINTWEFDGATCYRPHIVHISGDIFVIAYNGPATHGELITVDIASDGTITPVDSAEFDATRGDEPRVLHIAGTVYAIIYAGALNTTVLKTLNIQDDGTIGGDIGSLSWASFTHSYCEIIYMTGTIYAVAYHDGVNQGTLGTVSIQTDGTIGGSLINTWIFSTTSSNRIAIIAVTPNMIACAYKDPDGDGVVKTNTIGNLGSIGAGLDDAEFDTLNCDSPRILWVSGGIYAINYAGTGQLNKLRTLEISPGVSGGNLADVLVKVAVI